MADSCGATGHAATRAAVGAHPRPPRGPRPLPPTRNDPVAAVIAEGTRRNDRSPLCRIKTAPYLDNILALEEARRRGAQDAVLLNTRDRVVSAAYANLFCVIGGALLTPPLEDGPLPGITRQRVMTQLGGAERSLSADDLKAAEEVFFSNSFGLRPVTQLDDVALPGAEGAWARKASEIAG